MTPNIGAHMSIAGGLDLALERGREVGCVSIAMFCKSSNQWRAKPVTKEEVGRFRDRRRELGIRDVVAHASYLVNLASPDPALLRKSRDAFLVEMERCEGLGIESLVLHPGAHMGAGIEAGLDTLAASFDDLHGRTRGYKLKVLLEITAGAGSTVGGTFEHLKATLDRVRDPSRLAVCLDTCHLFAAGYDISSPAGWADVMKRLDASVGIGRIRAWHANDSKKGLGSRLDRHENLGKGALGLEAFRCLMTDPRFEKIPKILETPKENDMDPVNLGILRKLSRKRLKAER